MQLPGPLRAALGLAANVADEARRLPDRAIEVPMLAVSTALQMSLRAQQRYARLTARGDEILRGKPGDDPPPWATFDDPVPAEELRSVARDQLGDSPDASRLLDELFGPPSDGPSSDGPSSTGPSSTGDGSDDVPPPTPITSAKKAQRKTAKKSGGATGKSGKSVSKPRHTAPSKFDDVGDD